MFIDKQTVLSAVKSLVTPKVTECRNYTMRKSKEMQIDNLKH